MDTLSPVKRQSGVEQREIAHTPEFAFEREPMLSPVIAQACRSVVNKQRLPGRYRARNLRLLFSDQRLKGIEARIRRTRPIGLVPLGLFRLTKSA